MISGHPRPLELEIILAELSGYIWVIIIGSIVLLALHTIFKYKMNSFNAVVKEQRRKDKDMPDDELQMYLANPEETIKGLMSKRELVKNDAGQCATINQQIKMLEMVCKIPAPMRPTVVKLGKKLLSGLEHAF